MIEKLLIIPDCHAHPQWSNDRFEWLGKYIVDEQPDRIVCLGDFADMPSLSSYDKGTKGFEGRRYYRDVEVTIDAQERLWGPLERYNAERRGRKEKQYRPLREMILGNHEDRINRVTNAQPELDQAIGVEDLGYSRYWDRVWDFKEHVQIEGIVFCHFLSSGVMGRPIGGVNHAQSLLRKHLVSCVVGHSHCHDYAELTRGDGRKVFAIVGGCYVHPDFVESWCSQSVHLWWRGVYLLEGVEDGYYKRKTAVTMDWLKEKYA